MAMKSCRSLLNFSTRQHSHSTSLSLLRYTQTRSIVTSSNSFVLSSNHLTRPLSNTRHQFKRNYGVEEFFDQTKDELGRTRQIGRAWRTSELRLKSFEDLQRLWIVLLKERNMLLTERDHAKKKNAKLKYPGRLKKVKVSMNRIKAVVQERSVIWKKLQTYRRENGMEEPKPVALEQKSNKSNDNEKAE